MQFETTKKELLTPLKMVTGVVEQRHTLPILGNVLVKLQDNTLHFTASDQEVEIACQTPLSTIGNTDGETTLPAKKLLDLVRSLSDESVISITMDDNDVANLKAGKSRFKLKTLPATDFPDTPPIKVKKGGEFSILQRELKTLFAKTAYAMAVNDVRFFMNGVLLETGEKLYIVATDGHRMAVAEKDFDDKEAKIIIPRKAILELSKLLADDEESMVDVSFDENHIQFKLGELLTMTSKLIDGEFPDWRAIVPQEQSKEQSKIVLVQKNTLKQALQRATILSHEKYKGIALTLDENRLVITAKNPQHEEAEDIIPAEYMGEGLEIGFNGNYILEAISTIDSENVWLGLTDDNASTLIKDTENKSFYSVVMPMRL